MRVAVGQEWELASATGDDPLILKVVELMDDYASVLVIRRSAPDKILQRSTMHVRDVIDAGVLAGGPGSLGARRRRERIAYLSELLLYAARKHGVIAGDDVRFNGRELVRMVATDENETHAVARAMLRQALAALGGTEITAWYADDVTYVLPVEHLRSAAA